MKTSNAKIYFLLIVFLFQSINSYSFEFEAAEMSLGEFARWYSDFSEKTVIVGKDVTGTINFKARNVDKSNIDEFFKSVITANGYSITNKNGMVVLSTIPEIDQLPFQENIPVLSAEKEPEPEIKGHQYFFKYSDVNLILPTLKQIMATSNISKGTNNDVLFNGSEKQIEQFLFFCSALDAPGRSVHVEAIIAEISLEEIKELSSSLFTGLVSDGVQAGSRIAEPFALLSPPVGAFVSLVNNGRFNALVRALETSDKSKLLSTPSLLVADRQTGRVVVGQEVPFVTGQSTGVASGTQNPFQTIQRADVGLILSVTPSIISDDLVRLTVNQTSDSVSASTFAADIVTNKRAFQTVVELRPGQVAFLGGLLVNDVIDSGTSIPVLSSIPYLGRLFKGYKKQVVTRNLTLILKVTVV